MEGAVREPVQVRAYEKLKRLLGAPQGLGKTPEDRYLLKIAETRSRAAASRQEKKEKRARDPKAPEKKEMKALIAKLDHEFSRYIRARDTQECEDGVRRGHCVTCSSYHTYAEFDCGHWIKRRKGGKLATRWHPMNSHAQCTHCNRWKGGAEPDHEGAIRKLHGPNVPEQLQVRHKVGPEPRRDEMERWLAYFKDKADAYGVPP